MDEQEEMNMLRRVIELIRSDIQSVFDRDPAARNTLEILLCYPGLHAVWGHRLAHWLWKHNLLLIARLPFAVPTDPVAVARSALYDDPFRQYALPQAVLRFKQGFGRLIRRKTDRGVVVILDRRIRSKAYGSVFLQSLPPCTTREAPPREMPGAVRDWLSAV